MSPNPAPLLPPEWWSHPPGAPNAALARGALTPPLPPLHRNHRPPLSPTPAASEPPFEIQNLGRVAQPSSQQSLRRQQRDVVARGALPFDEIAGRRCGTTAWRLLWRIVLRSGGSKSPEKSTLLQCCASKGGEGVPEQSPSEPQFGEDRPVMVAE